MKRPLIAAGLAAVLTAVILGQVQAQQILLRPAPTNIRINGLNNSVFSASLNGGGGLASTGQVAYPQSFPAAATRNTVPPAIVQPDPTFEEPIIEVLDPNGPTNQPPTVSDYSCATARPDFRYEASKLGFERQTSSSLGQVDMNFWSGLPPGTNRYVPLGEF